ncbi:H-2 class II histocompatibility antigen, I-E beta chain-like [Scomber japonicus]|uniref:H-2 class II histocompatibility antigen, I-E beta chain-like n=1 Tax=Scomber japonicus TaxID=13676 RepID=UPI002306A601|nr:H-2 class II histocompatibility antigen, I-E beta chain-like [Scomber japonicus]
MASSFLSFSFLFITVYTADGFMTYWLDLCDFNSTELKDIRYIRSVYYNKLEIARFDSSVKKYVGYTEYGVMAADYWNSGPELTQMKASRETYCQHNIGIWYNNVLTKSVKPYVRLHSEIPSAGNHPSMLVCSVYSFYPKHIIVKWLRDGQEVTSDITSTEEMADADWYYQIHSHLEYTPRSGEKISCKVEHASLSEPLYTDWDPSLPESETNKIAIGASGLILGLILSLAGFIYYKRKSRGRILVPSN